MKGQAAVMEYMVLMLMMVMVIVFVIIMVFGFQFISSGTERAEHLERQTLFVLQSLITSSVVSDPQYQKLSVLEDAKLTVITECDDIEEIFGEGVWINISMYYEKPSCQGLTGSLLQQCRNKADDIAEIQSTRCTSGSNGNYPECGYWEFCEENREDRMMYRSIPVNIHRKIQNELLLGVIEVGVPVGQ